jgi:hypothetical protein
MAVPLMTKANDGLRFGEPSIESSQGTTTVLLDPLHCLKHPIDRLSFSDLEFRNVHRVITLENAINNLSLVASIKRRPSREENVKNDSQ